VALDVQGNVILVGQTWSFDFPIPGGCSAHGVWRGVRGETGAAGTPAIRAVLNGASYLRASKPDRG